MSVDDFDGVGGVNALRISGGYSTRRALGNSGGRSGRGSARDVVNFVGFERSFKLPVHSKIGFAVFLSQSN